MPKPPWLKNNFNHGAESAKVHGVIIKHNLKTRCLSSKCPNIQECWSLGNVNFMVLGNECTRKSRIHEFKTNRTPKKPDEDEPYNLARAINELELEYATISSVNRDDIPDGGAEHFAHCIEMIKRMNPKTIIEASIPDFANNVESLKKIAYANPVIVSHSLDVVKRLMGIAKGRCADYERSLDVLKNIKRLNPAIITKSSLIVGLRETEAEIYATMRHLRKSGVDILAIGHYLQFAKKNLKVLEYVNPVQFEKYELMAYRMGFNKVAAGPLIKNSHHTARFIFP